MERRNLARWLGIAAGVMHLVVPRLVWLPQDPWGPGMGQQGALILFTGVGVAAIVGVAASVRLPSVGAALVTAAAIVSVFGTVWEYRPIVFLLSIPLIAAAVLLLVPSRQTGPPVRTRRAVLAGLLLGGYVVWRGLEADARRYRRSYPDSTTVKPPWVADWLWVGGVTTRRATVTAGGLADVRHRCTYWRDGSDRRWVEAVPDSAGVARFELDDLEPGTTHHYRVDVADGVASPSRADASFSTAPAGPHDVTIAFGSCAITGSNSPVFDAIRAVAPDLFIHLGDLHYGNLSSPRADDHLVMLSRAISSPAQSALFSTVPTAWVWDDHDFGPNDSNSTSRSRRGALANYRRAVPHWSASPDPGAPINQAFTIGRVRVVVIDTRSDRTDATMLGAEQEAWLIDELTTSARTHALVVWANPAPWNVPDRPGTDQWGGYGEERRRIANAIAAAGIDNLVMVSGDWHLAAIDDGTNTGFADDGGPGFPLIHGAPLDRAGARVSDMYSHGTFSNSGQFGTVEVIDNGGSSIQVTLTCHLWTGEELGQYGFSIDLT